MNNNTVFILNMALLAVWAGAQAALIAAKCFYGGIPGFWVILPTVMYLIGAVCAYLVWRRSARARRRRNAGYGRRFRAKRVPRLIQHDDGGTEIVYYYTPQIFRFPFWMDILVRMRRLYNDGTEIEFREEWRSESTDRFQSLEYAEHILKKYSGYLEAGGRRPGK